MRGSSAAEELAAGLVASARAAGDRMGLAAAMAARLPGTFAGLAAGRVDAGRAGVIWWCTRFLSGEHAACADEVLAAAAPGLRHDRLADKAAALEMRLDPAGVRRRKEDAGTGGRVVARREPSGNMSCGGRELAAADVLAARARIDADAVALRAGGAAGSLRELRVVAFQDRLQGRNPLGRLTRRDPVTASPGSGCGQAPGTSGGPPPAGLAVPPGSHEPGPGADDEDEGRPAGRGAPGAAGGPAPLPALITLVVPAGWCLTITGPDGTAAAHGCARGQHPWTPAPAPGHGPGHGPGHPGPGHPGGHGRGNPGGTRDGPDPGQAAQLAALLRALNLTLAPVATGNCDHRHREDRYTPSRALKHLIRARTTRCTAPGCDAQAQHCDLDHTVAWPAGITCECDLSPLCRRYAAATTAASKPRLDTRATPARHHALDHTIRPHLHHPPHPVRRVSAGLSTGSPPLAS